MKIQILKIKIFNKILVIIMLFLLANCVIVGKGGYYVPENKAYLKKYPNGNTLYYIDFPFSEKQNIPIYLQRHIGGGRELHIIIPPLMSVLKNKRFEENNTLFQVRLFKRIEAPEDLKNNIMFYLKVDNKIYKPKIKPSQWNSKITNEYQYFEFPIAIKDVKKGILIIEYQGIRKEMPFKYDMLWYYQQS